MGQTTMQNVELNMPNLNKEEQEKYAEMFSEGSEALKELLLYLWQNGINTYASCIGHKDSIKMGSLLMSASKPYIFFEISSLSDEQFENLLIRLSKPAGIFDTMRFDYQVSKDRYRKDKKERTALTVYFKHSSEENFKYLLQTMKAVKNNLLMRFDLISEELNNPKTIIDKINSENARDFIKSGIRLKNISLTDYHMSNEPIQYGSISLRYNNSINLVYSTADNLVKNQLNFINDDTGKVVIKTLAAGYTTKLEDGKYYTTTNGKDVVEISEDQARVMPRYKTNEKYNNWSTMYSAKEFDSILEEIENKTKELNEELEI